MIAFSADDSQCSENAFGSPQARARAELTPAPTLRTTTLAAAWVYEVQFQWDSLAMSLSSLVAGGD